MANTYSKYEDKQDLNVDTSIPRKNKCIAEDLNYLKYQLNVGTGQDIDYSVNVIHSKNLFNKNTIIGNTKLKTDGSTEASTSGTIYCTSQYIEVYGFTKYTFSTTELASEDVRIVEYDANKKFIKYTDHAINESYTITTDNDTKYIRVSMSQNIGYTNSCQIELGETKTDYENFVEDKTIMDGDTRDSVSVNTTNDERKRINFIKSRNLFNANNYKYVKAGFNASSPNLIPNDNATTVCIPVKPNTYYSVKKNIGANLFIALSSVEPTTSSAITNNNGNALLSELNILTKADTKYLVILAHTTSIDTETLATTLNGLMVEQSYIYHDYEPYTTNSIKVDNETFTETLKVGTEVDDRSRVNLLHSKNLFDGKLELGSYDNTGSKITSTNLYRNVNSIQVKPNTTYTFSINGTSQKYCLYYYNSSNTFISNDLSLTTGTFTTPNNCYYINFRCFSADFTNDFANLKVQLNEGSQALPYEPYVVPSINVDGETIYQKPVVLWTNSSPTSNFSGGNITLNDSINNYSFYEVVYKSTTSASSTCSSVRLPVSENAMLQSAIGYSFVRHISSKSGTTLTFTDCVYYASYGTTTTTTSNNACIPIMVLGYK